MSAEEAVSDALQKPVDQNAEAAADAKKLLAELDAGENGGQSSDKEENFVPKNGESAEDSNDKDQSAPNTKAGWETSNGSKDKGKGYESGHRDSGDKRGSRNSYRGKGSWGGHNNNSGRDNIKSVLTKEEKSSDHDAIRKQVEFYFSDSNLPTDQFLFNKVGGSLNNPVEIELIRTFKRMRHFEPLEAIIEALKTSKTLNLVENDSKVQRKVPLDKILDAGTDPEKLRIFEDKAMPRSIYAKGFGPEVPSTQFDIEAFFAPYGPTNAIRLRRTDDKLFKGSVFVEFENEELAEAFLALEPKPKYHDRDLQIMSKKEYCDKKIEDIKAGKIRATRDRPHNTTPARKGGRGGGHNKRRRDEDDRDWRTRREEDQKNGRRNRDGRDRRSGGRERRKSIEKDDRNIPMVKASTNEDRDTAKEDALAKARAAVEAEESKENGSEHNVKDTTNPTSDLNSGESTSKKRERADDASIGSEEPAAKKIDSKT